MSIHKKVVKNFHMSILFCNFALSKDITEVITTKTPDRWAKRQIV